MAEYPKWMDEVPWRGDGKNTCIICGEPLNGRMFQCQKCSNKVAETMTADIMNLIDPA
jgi:hypothetical protein